MTDKPKKLSDTARALLTAAARRNDHLIVPPKLPVAAARQVVRSMLSAALVEEVPAPIEDATYDWRTGEDGRVLMLRATASGLDQIAAREAATAVATRPIEADQRVPVGTNQSGSAPPLIVGTQAPLAASAPIGRTARLGSLRQAAQAMLDAWDGSDGDLQGLTDAIAVLRATLAASGGAPPSTRSSQRPETKQAQVLTMLARDEGASGPQIAEAMSWAPHTVRGFLAGLPRKGIRIEVLERVRQVAPNKQGAKVAESVYRLVERPVLTESYHTVSARAFECRGDWSVRDQQAESLPELRPVAPVEQELR
jgi:hypothetical protein